MTTIFVSYTKENAECAEHIRQSLEARGYCVWREQQSLSIDDILHPRSVEHIILGSAAIILVWSSSAALSEWVERQILFAQRLKKTIFPVVLDATDLPNTLVVDTTITGQALCNDTVALLVALPNFPSSQSTDPLIKLAERAAHEFIGVRKEAVDLAADILKRNEHREVVLAILEYLARHDLMAGVRDKAQEVLEVATKQAVPVPLLHPEDSRHTFQVKCKKCGHITSFDKRVACSKEEKWREIKKRAGKELDVLQLFCEQCKEEMFVHVDCEGYK